MTAGLPRGRSGEVGRWGTVGDRGVVCNVGNDRIEGFHEVKRCIIVQVNKSDWYDAVKEL